MLHRKAFWAMMFFLAGVALAGVFRPGTSGALPLLISALVAVCIGLLGRYQLALCSLAMILGATYYVLRVPVLDIGAVPQEAIYQGVVQKVKLYPKRQTLTVAVSQPAEFVVQVSAQRYPVFAYGDEINITGAITPFEKDDARLLRDRAVGIIRFPSIGLLGTEKGNRFRGVLYALRDRIAGSFQKTLPPEAATFMTGLTLGKSAAFSEELSQQMKLTGTTHLVALSGTNVTIIVKGVILLFGFWFSRRTLFPLTITAITLFVLMTGAEASVVRAAIMAGIVLLAERTGRVHVTSVAIAAAALVMVLVNPAVLMFDIGFQLSFFALLGIVYLQPVLENRFHVSALKNKGALLVVKTLCASLAAQLAVFPLSLIYFGFASVLSIVPNLLILLLIPYTMLGGLFIFLASILSDHLALIVALPSRFLLAYELGVIHFFSRFPVGVSTESFPLALAALYYVLIAIFIVRTTKRERLMTP